MTRKDTMKEAGYRYVCYAPEFGAHVLEPLNEPGKRELWTANKGHASYGIRYKNTDLEFCSTLQVSDAQASALVDQFVEVRNFMKLYGTAPEKARSDWFMKLTDPARNKRGTVYSQQWIDKALTIMKLR